MNQGRCMSIRKLCKEYIRGKPVLRDVGLIFPTRHQRHHRTSGTGKST